MDIWMEKYVLNNPKDLLTCSPDHMYKLKKELYGLKQALRAWYERLTEFLTINGYVRGGVKKTMFINKEEGKLMIT